MDCFLWISVIVIISLTYNVLCKQRNISFIYRKYQNSPQHFLVNVCEEKGIFIMNVSVYVSQAENYKCNETQVKRNVNWNNTEDRQFLMSLKRECNGQMACRLRESTKFYLPVHCAISEVDTDGIELTFECKPITPNNKTVFDISNEHTFWLNEERNRQLIYLVLNTSKQFFYYKCMVGTDRRKHSASILYVDWGPDCTGKEYNYTNGWIKTNKKQTMWCDGFKSKTTFDFDDELEVEINTRSSLIWIELNVYSSLNVHCTSHKSSTEIKTRSTESATSTLNILNISVQSTELSTATNITTTSSTVNSTKRPMKSFMRTHQTLIISIGAITLVTLLVLIVVTTILCKRTKRLQNLKKETDDLLKSNINVYHTSDYHTYHEISDISESNYMEIYPYGASYTVDATQTRPYIELEENRYNKE